VLAVPQDGSSGSGSGSDAPRHSDDTSGLDSGSLEELSRATAELQDTLCAVCIEPLWD